MKDFLFNVANFLEELSESNAKLLKELKSYQTLLVDGEPSAIEKATPKIDRLTSEIRRLDEERRLYVDDFFNKNGWDGPRNFTAISHYVRQSGVSDEEAAYFERAQKARMKLIEILAEVDAQNSLNITLIGQGLSFAELSLRAILGATDKPTEYGPKHDTDEGPSFLDAQV